MTQPNLINLHPNEYCQGVRYNPYTTNLDRIMGSYYTLNGLSNIICVVNKAGDLNLNDFNMITGITKSKTLTKHLSCKCKSRSDGSQCNLNQKFNNNKCCYEGESSKKYVWERLHL